MGARAIGFRSIDIDADLQGKGFGMAAYVAAIDHAHKQGDTFTSDVFLTEHSKRVWDKLAAKGVAVKLQEPVEMAPGVHMHGQYDIYPRKRDDSKEM